MLVAAAPARTATTAPTDARVVGTFQMFARVTSAYGIPSEKPGQLLKRTWTLLPGQCAGSVCQTLTLLRDRDTKVVQRVTLQRTGPGTYSGSSAFWVALRCEGRTFRLGSYAPFTITLTVASAATVQNIAFARTIKATYRNPRRTDTTKCPLGPVHDAARYQGSAATPVPNPPTAAFSQSYDASSDSIFKDTSQRGAYSQSIVAWHWDFGDPTAQTDTADTQNPTHRYTVPGNYTVTETVTDGNGLTASTQKTVTYPPPAPPAGASTAPR